MQAVRQHSMFTCMCASPADRVPPARSSAAAGRRRQRGCGPSQSLVEVRQAWVFARHGPPRSAALFARRVLPPVGRPGMLLSEPISCVQAFPCGVVSQGMYFYKQTFMMAIEQEASLRGARGLSGQVFLVRMSSMAPDQFQRAASASFTGVAGRSIALCLWHPACSCRKRAPVRWLNKQQKLHACTITGGPICAVSVNKSCMQCVEVCVSPWAASISHPSTAHERALDHDIWDMAAEGEP